MAIGTRSRTPNSARTKRAVSTSPSELVSRDKTKALDTTPSPPSLMDDDHEPTTSTEEEENNSELNNSQLSENSQQDESLDGITIPLESRDTNQQQRQQQPSIVPDDQEAEEEHSIPEGDNQEKSQSQLPQQTTDQNDDVNNTNTMQRSGKNKKSNMALGCIPLVSSASTASIKEKSSCEYYNDHIKLEDGDLPSLSSAGSMRNPQVTLQSSSSAGGGNNSSTPVPVTPENESKFVGGGIRKKRNWKMEQPSPETMWKSTTNGKKETKKSVKIQEHPQELQQQPMDEDDGYVTHTTRKLSPTSRQKHRAFWNQLEEEEEEDDDNNSLSKTPVRNNPGMQHNNNVRGEEDAPKDEMKYHNDKAEYEEGPDDEDDDDKGFISMVVEMCADCSWMDEGSGRKKERTRVARPPQRQEPSNRYHPQVINVQPSSSLNGQRQSSSGRRSSHRGSAIVENETDGEADDDTTVGEESYNDDASYKLTRKLRENEKKLMYAHSDLNAENYENTAIEVEYMGPVVKETKSKSSSREEADNKAEVPGGQSDSYVQLNFEGEVENSDPGAADVLSDIVPPTSSYSEFINTPVPSDEKGGYILEKSKSWSTPEKSAYLRAMAQKAKDEFRRKKGLDINGDQTDLDDDEDSLEEILDMSKNSSDDPAMQEFTVDEKSRYLQMVNSEGLMTPKEAQQMIFAERNKVDESFDRALSDDESKSEDDTNDVIPLVKSKSQKSDEDSTTNADSSMSETSGLTSATSILSNMQKKPGFNKVIPENEVLGGDTDSVLENMRKKPGFQTAIEGNLDRELPLHEDKQKRNEAAKQAKTEADQVSCGGSILGGRKFKKDSKKGSKWQQMADESSDEELTPARIETTVNNEKSRIPEENDDIFTFDNEAMQRSSTRGVVTSPLTPHTPYDSSTPLSSIHLDPYQDSCDVSMMGSMLGSVVNNDNMSVVSGRSMYTTATNATDFSVSTRKRHRGAAKKRVKETKEEKTETKPDGWVQSMKAAAAASNQEWDAQKGFINYVEPEDPREKYVPEELRNLGKLKAPISSEPKEVDAEKYREYEDSVDAEVPFPPKWSKDREEMLGGDAASAITEVVSNKHEDMSQPHSEDEDDDGDDEIDHELYSLDDVIEEETQSVETEEGLSKDDAASAVTEAISNGRQNRELKFQDSSSHKNQDQAGTSGSPEDNLSQGSNTEDSGSESSSTKQSEHKQSTKNEGIYLEKEGILSVEPELGKGFSKGNKNELPPTIPRSTAGEGEHSENNNEIQTKDRDTLYGWIDGTEPAPGIFCAMGSFDGESKKEENKVTVPDQKESGIKDVIEGTYLDHQILKKNGDSSLTDEAVGAVGAFGAFGTKYDKEKTNSAESDTDYSFNESHNSFDFSSEDNVQSNPAAQSSFDDGFKVIQNSADIPPFFKSGGYQKVEKEPSEASAAVSSKAPSMASSSTPKVHLLDLESTTSAQSPKVHLLDLDSTTSAQSPKVHLLDLDSTTSGQSPKVNLLDLDNPPSKQNPRANLLDLDDSQSKDNPQVDPLDNSDTSSEQNPKSNLVTDDVSAFGGDTSVQTYNTGMSSGNTSMSSRAVEWRKKFESRQKTDNTNTVSSGKSNHNSELRESNDSTLFVSAIDENSTVNFGGTGSDSVFGNLENDTVFDFADNVTAATRGMSIEKESKSRDSKERGSSINSRSSKVSSKSLEQHGRTFVMKDKEAPHLPSTSIQTPPVDSQTVASDITSGTSGTSGSIYGPKKNDSFLTRLQSCAAPVIGRMEERDDGGVGLPSAHLEFLRKSQTKSPPTSTVSQGSGKQFMNIPILCGRPEVINEEDEENENEMRQESKSDSHARSMRTSSIASSYLEAIRNPKDKKGKAPSDIVSPSGVRSTRSQAWKEFIERRNNSMKSEQSTSSAEIYAAKKVDEVIKSISNEKTQNFSNEEIRTEPSPTATNSKAHKIMRGRSNGSGVNRPTRVQAAKAAEDLAAARVEAMMSTSPTSELEEGEI